MNTPQIKLVVSDLAGTVVDFGSCAPAAAFVELFAREGIAVTEEQCRTPMGRNKRDHIIAVTVMPGVIEQCAAKYGGVPGPAVIDRLYDAFVPLQIEVLTSYTEAIDGAAAALEALKSRGVKVAFTTGYNREMTSIVLNALERQGMVPDCSFCSDDVPAGRPAPWMIFRAMEALGVYPPSSVLNVGDTFADIQSGLNAGAVSVGVYATGNLLGMGKARFDDLPEDERRTVVDNSRRNMIEAGANYVISSVAKLPDLIHSL